MGVVIASTLGLSACSDDQAVNPAVTPGSSTFYLYNPTNANNPFTDIGELHNMALDVINDSAGGSYAPLGSVTRAGITADFIIGLNSSDNLNNSKRDSIIATIRYADTTTASLSEMYSALNLNSTQRAYINATLDAIELFDTSVDSVLYAITQIEDEIAADQSLSNAQKELPQVVAAVAKHSAAYWAEADDVPPILSRSKLLETDAKGAIKGAFAGWVTGGIVGFIGGSVPGAAIGAIGGSTWGGLFGAIAASSGWDAL